MQSRVRMSQIYGQAQATWFQAGHLTPRALEALDTVSSPPIPQEVCEGLSAPAVRGAVEAEPPRSRPGR